ncbi:hypothetical protein PVAND_012296 [Polypedilum vanderplanki]|uniref:Zinc finger protein n=1 Tax=Polypedilum vanderplanki TaxID=319348 RepID=A0A9J6CMZ2_POLVA|nr:hypothetical protein PVAND_012296 [Polypedilum vanderplanki]
MNATLSELLNCCRCCAKFLIGEQKPVKITKSIKTRFFQLTSIELLESEYYSNNICESCNSKLSEFSDFRNELTEYQNKLYEMYIEEEAVQEEEEEVIYLEEEIYKHEEDGTNIIDDDYIVEEVDSIEHYNENENDLMTTCNTEYQVLSETEYQIEPKHRRKSEKVKVCEVCNQTLAASGLYHHMMRFHSIDSKYECDYCQKAFSLKNDLITHMKRHLNRESRTKYPCSDCGRELLSQSSLVNHKKLFHSDIIEIHQCEYCPKTFRLRMKLLQHQKLVHQSIGSFCCHICNKTFDVRAYLEKHIENVHGEAKPCNICGKMYKPASLKRHMFSHDEKKFKCPYENCEKIYQMKISLKNHIVTHHEVNSSVDCEHCGTNFPSKRHLNRHVQRQHTSEKLQCEVEGCSNLFSRKDYLVEHYKKHKNINDELRNELLARVKKIKIISW